MKRLWWAVAFLVLLAGGGVMYQSVLKPARSQTAQVARPAPVVPVVVASVVRQAVPVRTDTIGSVQTIANVQIKSRIDGYVDSVLMHDGQYVKAGDPMFRLDGRAAQAQVNQMQAQLARDEAQLANARRDVARYAPLVAKDFVSHQQYDTAGTTAQALEAAVNADQAMIENAKVLLSYDTILAPIDGRVGAIGIKAGNSLKANDVPLATINQIKPIYVNFSLPEAEFPDLRAALGAGPVAVRVEPQGDTGGWIDGKVAFFDNNVNVNTGTIAVRAVFANDDERLWPGQFVHVSVTTRTDADALTVPPAAVQVGRDGNFVFIVKPDNTAEARPVTIARTVEDKVVVSAGLAQGDKVVIDGQMRLIDGSRVAPRAAQPAKPDRPS